MRNPYGYGIIEPSGEPYFDEACVWGAEDHGKRDAASVCDHLNDEIAEGDLAEYRVVELFWESEEL